ncbi:MAG: cell division FtsA domain-containing protein [Lachnospira sp.]
MENKQQIKEDVVFGLDIGTRNIVGVVGYIERDRFKVIAMAQQEHETRAMLDGQIHDIYKVGDTIRKVKNSLEKQLDRTLTDVCIAAAGRVLKTVNSDAVYEFEEETRVTQEHIYSLNLLAVENAHNKINSKDEKTKFYCVGSTPIRYQLNGYDINNLEGHKADKIAVELIATFLPEEVVDGLYEAVEYAGLHVANLTLEPIAAMNIAIPEQYRLLNIGLVDVGAGTSDICLTKDGCIIAYGMIPCAGDEITERIAKTYLVDFNTAEKIKVSASQKKKGLVTFKDIMGITQKVDALEIRNAASDVVAEMAKDVADKIIELNGGKPVNAVFVVGGGGKIPGYTDKVADCLGIPHQRVAVRGEEVLTTVDFEVPDFKKDSLYVTPVGICTNYYTQKNNFVFVTVNNERIKLYDTSNLTVVDAVMQVGFPNEKLFPRRGAEINFTVNGKARLVRGSAGEGAVVRLNGRPANLHSSIEQNDVIEIRESTVGEPASITIGQLEEFDSQITFNVNDKTIVCPRFAYVNGELKSEFYDINDGDKIRMENFYTVAQLFEFLDLDYKTLNVTVNNEPADKNTRVYENFTVRTSSLEEYNESIMQSDTLSDSLSEDDIEADIQDEDLTEKNDTEQSSEPVKENVDITITVNGQNVVLSGKPDYIVVDLFQFYPFDLTMVRGNLVFLHNGSDADYSSPLCDGDTIELRWEEIKK